MKAIRILFLAAATMLICVVASGQKWTGETLCSTDTLVLHRLVLNDGKIQPEEYKIVQCKTQSNIAFRFEAAVSRYYYSEKTTNWIGQHGGPNLNFILTLNKLNFGFRFKPWTVNPKTELDFNLQTLPRTARLNVIKLDFYAGYSLDFERLFSIEPYIGYNRSSFLVLNEDELDEQFSFRKTGGLILGTTVNKYFKVDEYAYLSVFGSFGYAFVNYDIVHPDLDNRYFEWSLGLAIKGFFANRHNKKVE